MALAREVDPEEIGRFKESVVAQLAAGQGQAVSRATLMVRTEGAARQKRAFKQALKELVAEGKALELSGHQYSSAANAKEVVGEYRCLPGGRAFVIPERDVPGPVERRHEIRIGERDRDTALHGDRVRVRINRERRDGTLTGQVIAILERRVHTIVGQYYAGVRSAKVVPRDDRLDRVVSLPITLDPAKVKNGDWLTVRVTRYTRWPEPLLGEVDEILGSPGERGIDITVLLRSVGCREVFPEEVLREAEALPATLPEEDLRHRRDCREQLIVTIDGPDAKDFDDAITVRQVAPGRWRLGVHIADVSWYVREGTALDREAHDRATSIYPLDRVVPMLPERLSNDLCSLRPRVDRACLACEMTIDEQGRVLDREIFESAIHSRHRLTYEIVQELFDARDKGEPGPEAIQDAAPMLLEARALAKCLTAMRRRRGALDLDVPEAKVILDTDGRTVDVVTRQRLEAHQLIEEMMLIANEAVAEHMKARSLPTLYRIHGEPNPERVEKLVPVLRNLNIPAPMGMAWGPAQFQAALRATEQMPAGHVVRRLLLRVMMKAVYSHENIGHFGLASATYLHFTSPIRRYPDLHTHRVLRATLRLTGAEREAAIERFEDELGALGKHTSARERESMQVEYEAAAIKSAELLERHIGAEFRGLVVGMASAGIFVELTRWPVEGMVPLRSLPGRWDLNEEQMMLRNELTGQRFRVGDAVQVRIHRVEALAGRVELEYQSHLTPARVKPRHAGEVETAIEDLDELVEPSSHSAERIKRHLTRIGGPKPARPSATKRGRPPKRGRVPIPKKVKRKK